MNVALLAQVLMKNKMYSSVLKYRNLIAENGKIQNQISRELSRIQKFAS